MSKTSLKSLLLGLLLIAAVSNAKIIQRIVGGDVAREKQFKYQVSLQRVSLWDGCVRHFCGGSIIDRYHVITAAHCVVSNRTRLVILDPISVVAGTVDLRKPGSGVYRSAKWVFMPTDYVKTGYRANDIAILRLSEPFPLNDDRLGRIRIAKPNQYLPGNSTQIAVLSGFGIYQQKIDPNGKLLWESGASPILRYSVGMINYVAPGIEPCEDHLVCVSPFKRKYAGACSGDSGGPLVDLKTNTLIGISSYSEFKLCGKVEKFTRVSSYRKIIGESLYRPRRLSDDTYVTRLPIIDSSRYPLCGLK
ncbi:hypothetical protein TKK_0009304 [Trichogramma kaykai]|uniref:Peptidase S1 domain-containing protein n=1 Tax=Trichogramma kaykai TaxID=54128 RepID=A0ABD2X1U4_9HYME